RSRMFNAPKTITGRLLKKTIALVLAYSFLGTSVWALNAPGQGLPRRTTVSWASWKAVWRSISSVSKLNALAGQGLSDNRLMPAPKIYTNFADLNASAAVAQGGGGATTTANFFGPQEFVRTTGNPNTYTVTVSVPPSFTNPFNLHIQSG